MAASKTNIYDLLGKVEKVYVNNLDSEEAEEFKETLESTIDKIKDNNFDDAIGLMHKIKKDTSESQLINGSVEEVNGYLGKALMKSYYLRTRG